MEHVIQDNGSYSASVPTKELRYAGFWMRFWAFLADTIVVLSLRGVLLLPLKLVNEGVPIHLGIWTLNAILSAVIFYLYFLLMTKYFNQTIGKMIFGLKVVRMDLEPLRWDDLIFREIIGRFIYKAFFALHLLYIVVAFTPKKQGIHDMFVNTTVVHVD